ncbi:MAG: S8 family serine peptidase [Chloroflexi bacterium]|nr:S8 family serine peptidase [Chloroflexota bacterium]
MIRKRLPFTLLAIFFLSLSLWLALSARPVTLAEPRLDPVVQAAISAQGGADVLIVLGDLPDLSPAYQLPTKAERGRWVYDTLRRHARQSQRRVVGVLQAAGVPYQPFWSVNAIHAQLDAPTLARVLALPEVRRVQDNPVLRGLLPQPPVAQADSSPTALPWGIQRVQAPWAWDQGYTGAGVVVAGQDTGYNWDHPALKRSFRGYDPISDTVTFSTTWHDAIHTDIPPADLGNICGYDSPAPCDDHGHGTHTMGTMVGNDLDPADPNWPAGAPHAVGVAPGAKWIACRNMDNGWGQPATYIECFEWFTAPYPPGGDPLRDGDPTQAPDVINNSWGCPPGEGCTADVLNIIEPALDAADAAGIVVVVSAGNTGSSCSSILAPPALYPHALSLGATDSQDRIASFSSRGPIVYNGETRSGPAVSAPGVDVQSSIPGGGYANYQGTSMASPHAVGVIALLLSAAPQLRGQTDLIKAIIRQSADPVIDYVCGAEAGGRPNNRFGWGIVNARRAIESLSLDGTLAGAITTLHGQPLPDARIVVYTLDGQKIVSGSSDDLGFYTLRLPWGPYQVVVSRPGYETVTRSPVIVVGGQTTSFDLVLNTQQQFIPLIWR